MRQWIRICLLSIGVSLALTVMAQGDAQQIIQNRITNFREIGTAVKNLRDELESSRPDVSRIQISAQLIQERGAYMLEWFPPGSEPQPPKSLPERIREWFSFGEGFGSVAGEAKSQSKLVIWTERSDFEEKYRSFEAEAVKMAEAAQGGQIVTIATRFKGLTETCKNCHNSYREEFD